MSPYQEIPLKSGVIIATEFLKTLSDEDRLEVFAHFCTHCGTEDERSRCTCMRDD